ncbi:neural cell adhesion molecule 1-like [Galleria mellonella]|uniref:Neural cell adhesion molecule 1-like n=1 Tax=Galleria mellonella TaxID=7137 RepID=A0A6J3BVQ8_GALME|nr:neural cell adhesion molecule 1-like [Galleria mellonella]
MRRAIAVLVFSLVCSVSSTEPDDTEPRLQVMARSTVFNAGETKAIFCKAINIEGPIEWRNPAGGVVKERSVKNNRVYVERKEENTGILIPLIIHEIKISDSGSWTCKAGDLNETIDILVGVKVNITNRNETREGDEGKSTKLDCEAEGHPAPIVQWYRESKPIDAFDRDKYVMKKVKPHNYQLEIKNLSHLDVGEYVCKVTQKALSHYTDKTVYLFVKHKPVLYNPETRSTLYKTEEVYGILNETKNITCSALANPPPTYKWHKRHNNYDGSITSDDTVITAADGSSSVLILRMRSDEDTGEYVCTAINNRGRQSVVFHVTLGDKPNPPDFVAVNGTNATHINFNVICSTCTMVQDETVAPDPKNLTLLGFHFQLVPVEEGVPPDWDSAEDFDLDILSAEDTLFEVGPLNNSTTFHARVRSRNAAGYSEWTIITPNPSTTDDAIRLISSIILVIIALIATGLY